MGDGRWMVEDGDDDDDGNVDGDGDGDGDGGDDDRCCATLYLHWRLELSPQAVCSLFMTLASLCCAGVFLELLREHIRT